MSEQQSITYFFDLVNKRDLGKLEDLITIQKKIIQGQTAAVHWTNRGVSRKNEHYENEGVTILEMEGAKISFISDFFKDTEKF